MRPETAISPQPLPSKDEIARYLETAEALYGGRLPESGLLAATVALPPLTSLLLQALATQADRAALNRPRRAWAIMAVADAAAAHGREPFLQALAAWYLGRAAGQWVRPRRVEAAIARARTGFAQAAAPGWLAACTWQQNALPWTRPHFAQSAAALAQALRTLQQTGFAEMVPFCRLSLAYAHLLVGEFEAAAAQIERVEAVLSAGEDRIAWGKCLLTKSSCLRRQGHFAAAGDCLQDALAIFQQQEASVLVAMTYFQLAHVGRFLHGDWQTAVVRFQQAAEIFQASDLPLWTAQCYGGLAQIYHNAERMAEAAKMLRQAREIYTQYQISGLLADSLLDSGQFEMYRGNYTIALHHFMEAETLYRKIGNRWLPPVALMNQGEACLQLGRYQQALRYLEKAYKLLQELDLPQRMAACERRLARVWLQLDQPQRAHDLLDKAMVHYRQSQQNDFLPYVYNLRAEILFSEGQREAGIECLQEALEAAAQQGNQLQVALAHRLLGEGLCALGRMAEATVHLKAAEADFVAMGMVMEQAACQVAWGTYYGSLPDVNKARRSWKAALALNQDLMPDVTWRAQGGLAALAAEREDEALALSHYRLAVTALSRLRRELWQPAVAGAYLSRPAPVLDRAVVLATRAKACPDALYFIEESKAQIINRQFSAADGWQTAADLPDALADLAAEIRRLQEKIRVSFGRNNAVFQPAEVMALRRQLRQKVQAYTEQRSRLERDRWPDRPAAAPESFDLAQFRQQATATLGQKWVALDYYLAGENLSCVMVTPTTCDTCCRPISGDVSWILRMMMKPGQNGRRLQKRDLAILGEWLIPTPVQQHLTATTTLLIAPHRRLHRLSWAAFHLAAPLRPLVAACIPVVVPSLYSLELLWQRAATTPDSTESVLLLAVSDFQERWPRLPAVEEEVDTVSTFFGPGGQSLHNGEATWSTLQQLSDKKGLAHFDLLHVASHAFPDPVTGRLSGLALYDRDIWLDELWQLAPLPRLVTLSACSGMQSLVYEGDEHVGLPTTCLAAGTQHVVGSLWPIGDGAAARLMPAFYRYFQAGKGAAQALALAQRDAWRRGESLAQWGSFLCIGQP